MRCTTRLVPVVSFFLVLLAFPGSAQGVRVNGPLAPVPGLAAEDLRSLVGRRGIQILRENDLLA